MILSGPELMIFSWVGVALLGIAIGASLVYITGPRRVVRLTRTATRCHQRIAYYGRGVFCHLDYGHSGDHAAPLSEFEAVGYTQPPF